MLFIGFHTYIFLKQQPRLLLSSVTISHRGHNSSVVFDRELPSLHAYGMKDVWIRRPICTSNMHFSDFKIIESLF